MNGKLCESAEVCDTSATQASTLTIDMTNADRSAQHASFFNVKASKHSDFMQNISRIQILPSDQLIHDLCGRSNQNVKLANGIRGSIVDYLKISNRNSGAQVRSPKSGAEDQVNPEGQLEVRDYE